MTAVNRLTNPDGFDATEGVQVIYDALMQSMDAGSGMLDYRDWCALRQVAYALGLDLDQFAGTWSQNGYGTRGIEQSWAWPDPTAPLTDSPPGDDALTVPVVRHYARIETRRDRGSLNPDYRSLTVTTDPDTYGNIEKMAEHELLTRRAFAVKFGFTDEQVELLPIRWGSDTKYVPKDGT